MHWWKLEAEEFLSNFGPSEHPEVTYLLYEIQWGRSRRTWKNWCRNIHPEHAEIIFLEDEEVHDRPDIPCNITWFVPWTPCGACAYEIIAFLEERPNVNLEILAAQVYKPYDHRNRKGLRDLADEAQISIMEFSDYQYCWEKFVDHQGMNLRAGRGFSNQRRIDSRQLDSIINPF
ncbi:C-_U-editing enzyme APOBEC-1 isoform X2 [Anolis carolinensis]|uniref:C->U-editing enzyme APOBEC-1 isoform X2 n=1 Tax=Anolis carolinensis TaxID=28377 RepID=UPI002F2B7FB7